MMGDILSQIDQKYKSNLQTLDVSPEEILLSMELDGILYHPEKAKEGPCKCFEDYKGKELCWDKGIIGLLNQSQVAEFCPPDKREHYKIPEKYQERMKLFGLASEECEYGNRFEGKSIEDLEERFKCMHKYASKNNALTEYPPTL